MIYKQESSFLRYGKYPVSSHFYNYSPLHPEQPLAIKRDGCIRFCVPHNHAAIEVIRVISGEVVMTVNGERYDLSLGDIVFLNPFDVHSLVIERADVKDEYQCVNFDLSLLKTKSNTEFNEYLGSISHGELKFKTFIPHTHPYSEALNRSMQELHGYCENESTNAGYMMIAAELLRFLAGLDDGGLSYAFEKKTLSKQAAFSQAVTQYVSQNYALPLTTETIAEELHFNKSYFCRVFKSVFEQTFVEYLNSYRIYVAKSLPIEDYNTLGSLAESIGYTSYDSFTLYFKKYVGVTPKEFYKKG